MTPQKYFIIGHGRLRRFIISLCLAAFFAVQAYAIEPGDIVYSDTEGIWSGIGYSSAKKRFGIGVGHAGIYIGKKNGVDMVIHCAEYCGVDEITLEDFPGKSIYKGARTTIPAPTPEQRQKILKFAKNNLGKDCGYIPWKKKGPEYFDCTGFTEAAYEYAGLDPTPWWAGDLPYRYIWPMEQCYSPRMQYVDYGEGPVIANSSDWFRRMWMTYGYTTIWILWFLLIFAWRRKKRRFGNAEVRMQKLEVKKT